MQVALYSDNINFLDYWNENIQNCIVVEELSRLYSFSSCLIIINYTACVPSCATVFQVLLSQNNKILILDNVPDLEIAKNLLKLGAAGYGNTYMRKHFLDAAIETIKEGMVWLHPEFTTKLILDIQETKESTQENILNKLSNRECEVALLLKDGLTYNKIALKLQITPRTIKAHAQNIYAKLSIKDRLSLALLLR